MKPKTTTTSDPYCRCTLMPDKIVRQTKIVRKSLNLVFDEIFEYDVRRDNIENSYLLIDIFDFDKVSKNESFGFVKISLNMDFNENDKIITRTIKPYTEVGFNHCCCCSF